MKDIKNKRQRRKQLMVHIVAGFPTRAKSLSIARTLVRAGADILEIQIPFSDPIADGPTIVGACHTSLANGFASGEIFKFVHDLKHLNVPIVVMAYGNVPFQIGFDRFVRNIKRSGARGIIVPDLPYDSPDGIVLRKSCEKYSLNLIQVVSPGMSKIRLTEIIKISQGFIYCTTRKGTTGNTSSSHLTLIKFTEKLGRESNLPIAVGFGISTPKDIKSIKKHSDIVVVGSAIINKIAKDFVPSRAAILIKGMKKELGK